jgi:hypothetical protein
MAAVVSHIVKVLAQQMAAVEVAVLKLPLQRIVPLLVEEEQQWDMISLLLLQEFQLQV